MSACSIVRIGERVKSAKMWKLYAQNGVRWGVGASGKDDDETVNDDVRRGR
jgi:hypothetical protein